MFIQRHRLVKGCGGTSSSTTGATTRGSNERTTLEDRGLPTSGDKDCSTGSVKEP